MAQVADGTNDFPGRVSWREAKAQFEADAREHSRTSDPIDIQRRLEEDALRSELAFVQSWAPQIADWRRIVNLDMDDGEPWEGAREEQQRAEEGLRKYQDDLGKLQRTFDRRKPYWRHECLFRPPAFSSVAPLVGAQGLSAPGAFAADPSARNPASDAAPSEAGLKTERIAKRRSLVNELCKVLAGPDAEPLSRIDLATRLNGTDSAVRGVIRGDFKHGGRDLEAKLLEELQKAGIDSRDW